MCKITSTINRDIVYMHIQSPDSAGQAYKMVSLEVYIGYIYRYITDYIYGYIIDYINPITDQRGGLLGLSESTHLDTPSSISLESKVPPQALLLGWRGVLTASNAVLYHPGGHCRSGRVENRRAGGAGGRMAGSVVSPVAPLRGTQGPRRPGGPGRPHGCAGQI